MAEIKGFNTRRHATNPKEKELHDKFIESFVKNKYNEGTIHKLIFGSEDNHELRDYATEREQQIAISTIQWLGSTVGKSFLKECGFELRKK